MRFLKLTSLIILTSWLVIGCQPSQITPTPAPTLRPTLAPTPTSTPWVTPTPPYDPVDRQQIQTFCIALQEWLSHQTQLFADDNAFQEELESTENVTPEQRLIPSQLHESSMNLYDQARNVPRPNSAREVHDKLLEYTSSIEERYRVYSQMTENYSDDLYQQYVDKSREMDRLFYAFSDEIEDLFTQFDIEATDCILIYRSYFPLLDFYTDKVGWYPGPESGMAHMNIESPSFINLTVEETDQYYVSSFSYIYNTTELDDLKQGFQHIEEVLTLLLADEVDVSKVFAPLPNMVASFTGEEIAETVWVRGIPINTNITFINSSESVVGVYVVIWK